MKFAITSGSYRLPEFIELQIQQIRVCFGEDTPILICDDHSDQSPRIKAICEREGVTLMESRVKRGHFAGDMVTICNSIPFALAHKATIAVKVSQRFIFRTPAASAVLERVFSDPNIVFALPGKMRPDTLRPGGSAMFTAMPILSDMMAFRANAVDPRMLLEMWRRKCATEHFQWSQWVESLACDWVDQTFAGRSVKMDEFANPTFGQEPMYLRRNQHYKHDYLDLARRHGINGAFELAEWKNIERHAYNPSPVLI